MRAGEASDHRAAMRPYRLLPCFLAALPACAHTANVVTVGPDTYSISAKASPMHEKRAGARGIALSEARRHCANMERELLVVNVKMETRGVTADDDVEVVFKCLEKSDPALRKPAVIAPK